MENEEFHLESKIIRLIVYNAYGRSYYLNYNYMKIIFDNFNIDVVIYNRIFLNQIQFLLKLKKKLILIYHFQYLHFYYDVEKRFNYRDFDIFKYSNLMITLVPDDLFFWKKRGIENVIYLPNLLPFNIRSIKQSTLSSKNILMIGRGDDACKQFSLGIKAMVGIIKEIPDAKLIVVSSLYNIEPLLMLREMLDLEQYIDFVGYKTNPETYFQNSSIFFTFKG